MSTNGQLNGSLNGNGAHKPAGLLNGNGSLRVAQTKTKYSHLKNWWINYVELRSAILVYGSLAVLIGGLTIWNHSHPQSQPPPPALDPRTVQIERTIDNLQDAIDLLSNELPSKDEEPEYPDR